MVSFKKIVINLNRRPERLSDFFERYGGEDVERFSGVDGVALFKNPPLNGEIYILWKGLNTRNPGMLGCWLSHLSLWRLLAESETDAFVIFEDDAFFVDNFKNRLEKILIDINPTTMDLVYFGGRFKPDFKPKNLSNWDEDNGFFRPKVKFSGFDWDRTTHGYVITRRGALKLLDRYNSTVAEKGSFRAIDAWLEKIRFELDAFDAFPHLAYSPRNYRSDIQGVRI